MSSIDVIPTAASAQANAQAEVGATTASSAATTESSTGESSLGKLTNDPSTLHIAPGIELSELQRKHVALVLDLFQGQGTMRKIVEGFTEDAAYEDPVALSKDRVEVAGQLLHIPTVTSSTKTKSYTVSSLKPSVSTTTGQDRAVTADEILVDFVHDLTFKIGFTYELNTQLVIFSSSEEGKIVRLQDRPKERMMDNGLVNLFRRLNGIVAPKIAGIPTDEQEDEKFAKGDHLAGSSV